MMWKFRDVYILCIVLVSAFTTVVAARRPGKCGRSDPPCYNQILTYVSDGGDVEVLQANRSATLAHNALCGRDMKGAIAEGRRALAWFKEKYGIDFTYVPDSALLDGDKPVTSPDGAFTFHAWMLGPQARYRLVMASVEDNAEFFNTLVSDGGWIVHMNEDYNADARFKGLIPKGALVVFGNYAIPVGCSQKAKGFGKGKGYRNKNNNKKKNKYCNIFGTDTVVIHVETRDFFGAPPGGLGSTEIVIDHADWGQGSAIISLMADPARGPSPSVVTVLRFPATLP